MRGPALGSNVLAEDRGLWAGMVAGAVAGIAVGGLGPKVVRVGGLHPVLETVLTRYGAGGQSTTHVLQVSALPSNLDPVGQGPWVNHVWNIHQGGLE